MRVLAIADKFIPADMMKAGFAALERLGHEVVVREWFHPDVKALQADNLAVEQRGADAVELPAGLADDIGGYDMLVVQFAPVGGRLIARAGRLKWIGVLRAGTENVDAAAAAAAGIEVVPTPGRNARAVAEFTVGMILAETRNIARAHAAMKHNRFRKDFPNADAIPEMSGKEVGLIGLGHIGGMVARLLSSFDCRLLVYDPFLKEAPAGDLDSLLSRADVVSIHMRLTGDTRHMIGERELGLMKPTAYLINTARSGLVDENALVEALRAKAIMGAAIDVFEKEPLPAGHPFLGLDNITLTPHLAGSTRDAFANTPGLFCERFINDRLS